MRLKNIDSRFPIHCYDNNDKITSLIIWTQLGGGNP